MQILYNTNLDYFYNIDYRNRYFERIRTVQNTRNG